jgi:hypothetical protein
MNTTAILLRLALMGITCTDAPVPVREPVRLADPRAVGENCGAVAGWPQKFSGANGRYTFVFLVLSDRRPRNL